MLSYVTSLGIDVVRLSSVNGLKYIYEVDYDCGEGELSRNIMSRLRLVLVFEACLNS